MSTKKHEMEASNLGPKEWDDIPTGRDREPLIVSNLNEWDDERIPVRVDPNEPRRYVLCDVYAGGCGQGFTVGLTEYNSGRDRVCEPCTAKRLELRILKDQLKFAKRYGHTDTDCNLCAVQNQIDRVTGSDWREERDRDIERTMRPLERVMPGGAVY